MWELANRSLHDVTNRVLDDTAVGVELDRAGLRRRVEGLARGLIAEKAVAIVGAGGLRGKPDAARIERVGAEVLSPQGPEHSSFRGRANVQGLAPHGGTWKRGLRSGKARFAKRSGVEPRVSVGAEVAEL